MSRLVHLNGPPGIGKSTIARRYVDEHPGTLNCDIDILRTLVGGWQENFGGAGELIRPAALAMITAYLRSGHDVVLPQMIFRLAELERFEAAASDAEAEYVACLLMDDLEPAVARFHRRGTSDGDPWHQQVRDIVASSGGDEMLASCHRRLEDLLVHRPGTVVITSVEGSIEQTYRAFVGALS